MFHFIPEAVIEDIQGVLSEYRLARDAVLTLPQLHIDGIGSLVILRQSKSPKLAPFKSEL